MPEPDRIREAVRPVERTTGLHHVHVFPQDAAFAEIAACYRAAAARLGWMSVEGLEDWSPYRLDWRNPEIAAVFWGRLPEIPADRSVKVVLRYTESVGRPEALVENQRREIREFIPRAGLPDLVITGCPAAAEFMAPFCRNTAHAPVGYDAETMGTPEWYAVKEFDLVFYGTPVGRREWILPAVEKRLGRRFLWIGCFGAERKTAVERARYVLHVGHSAEASFPGMRLWQAAATSAALITEKWDAWPAAAGTHYVELAPAAEESLDVFLDALENALGEPHGETAWRAHEDLSRYTVERCVEEFVVPAVKRLVEGNNGRHP